MEALTDKAILESLRNALNVAEASADDAYTTRQISDAIGLNEKAVRYRLRLLMEAGHVECVRKMQQRIDGTTQPVPAYRFINVPQ